MTTLFHRTTAANAAAILAHGFLDGEGGYLTSAVHRGVWVSNVPLDENEGAFGDTLLAVRVSIEDLAAWACHEWREDGKGYREWLVPAAEVNRAATLAVIDCEAPSTLRALVPGVVIEDFDSETST